jgi:hypothetical protein
VSSSEARYGAFRATYMMDPNEPAIAGEKLGDDFYLHVVDTRAEPMVHAARSFRPEIVIFGGKQKMLAPFVFTIGSDLIVSSQGDGNTGEGAKSEQPKAPFKIQLASFKKRGKDPQREESSPELADVIRKAAALGAKYPEIVELLRVASANGALEGRLEINALPRAVHIASLVAAANADEKEMQQLPVGLPSMFQDDQGKAWASTARPESNDPSPEPKKKKSWWDSIFHRSAQ